MVENIQQPEEYEMVLGRINNQNATGRANLKMAVLLLKS